LNLFGIWDANKDLNLYSIEGSLTSEVVIEYLKSESSFKRFGIVCAEGVLGLKI